MKSIGGFFELELNKGLEYHSEAIKLNTGRNALEYILRVNRYTKVYLPTYICDSLFEPMKKLGIDTSFYPIDIEFNPIFDFKQVKEDELFLYVNYFGVCDNKVEELTDESNNINICIDNTQSFFSKPVEGVQTFYSARKFFGVADGAYLYNTKTLDINLEKEVGYDKSSHLLKRIDIGSSESYKDFRLNSSKHKNQPIRKMSNLTKSILQSLNYDEIQRKRWENFLYIHEFFQEFNEFNLSVNKISCPMVYPLLYKNGNKLRSYFVENNIFTAQYWPNVLETVKHNSHEYELVNNLVTIPIDQRYTKSDMDIIINTFKSFIKEEAL